METRELQKEYLSKIDEILPCPFCGNKYPFGYHNAFTAYLGCRECSCIIGSAPVLYKQDQLPEELKGLEAPADALIIIAGDGSRLSFPEHEYFGINCVTAFDHAGLLKKWNKRN